MIGRIWGIGKCKGLKSVNLEEFTRMKARIVSGKEEKS
jgi:hypothetical protein